MRKIYPQFLLLASLLALPGGMKGQSSLSMGMDLMSRYIWRGLDLGGNAPSLQPSLKYSYTTKNELHSLSAGAWGAYCLSGNINDEIDLSLSYLYHKMLSLTVTDYFFPGLNTGEKDEYFIWSPDSTGHVLEVSAGFTGNNKVPVTALFAMNFYGNDARHMLNDTTEGTIVMSKYLELGFLYSFSQFDMNAWVGAALDGPVAAYDPYGYYQNKKAGIINIGLKVARSFKLTDHLCLPVQAQFIMNPMLQKAYLVGGISIAFCS